GGRLLEVGVVVCTKARQTFVAELVPGKVELEQATEEGAAMAFHPLLEFLRRGGIRQVHEGRVAGLAPLAREVVVEEDAADDEGDGSDEVVEGPARKPLTPPLNRQDKGVSFDLFTLFRLHERSLLARAGGDKSFVFR